MKATVLHGDCASLLNQQGAAFGHVDLTFLDPPFNQDKGYNEWDDNLPEAQYWKWMGDVCTKIYHRTASGGAIYFNATRKENGVCVAMSARIGVDVSKLDHLEKENVRCPRHEAIWQTLPDYCVCKRRGSVHGYFTACESIHRSLRATNMNGKMACSSPMCGTISVS